MWHAEGGLRRAGLLAAAALATPVAVLLTLRARPAFAAATLLNTAIAIVCVVAAWAALARARRTPGEAGGWRWAAAAVACQCLYQAGAIGYALLRGRLAPYPTGIELLQIAALVCGGLAVALWTRGALAPRLRLRMVLDAAILAVATFVIVWVAAGAEFVTVRLSTTGDRLLVIAELAIIASDLGLVAYLGRIAPPGLGGPAGWIIAALFAATGASAGATLLALEGRYVTGHPQDVLLLAAVLCVVLAARTEGAVAAPGRAASARGSGLVPYLVVLVALGFAAWPLAHPAPRGDPLLAVLVGIAGLAVLLRQHLALSDVQALSAGLEGTVTEGMRDLARSRAALESAQRLEAVGRMAGGIADEFRRLVASLEAPVAVLDAAVPPGHPDREAVDEIRAAGRRGLDLTQQLLTFAHRQAVEPHEVDVNALLVRSAPLLRQLAGRAVTLELRPGPEAARVFADPTQLEQLLANLTVNARDAMPDGGTLTIETRTGDLPADDLAPPRPRRCVRLLVADTGTGMDETTLARIFEPFFTTKPPGRGTGLGLATCYGIVSRAGGRIAVESWPGRGAVFTIELPLADTRGRVTA